MTMQSWLKQARGGGLAAAAGAFLAVTALAGGGAFAADYHQAPMLDDLVKSGKLPPVARAPAGESAGRDAGREGRRIWRHLAQRHGRRLRPQLDVPHHRL